MVFLEPDFLIKISAMFRTSTNQTVFSLFFQDRNSDTSLLVRALDRFYRRLTAMNKLLLHTDFARAGNDIVLKISREKVQQRLETLKQQFSGKLVSW